MRALNTSAFPAASTHAERLARRGFPPDGFPRSLPRATAPDEILASLGMPIECIVNVAVPDEKIRVRLDRRTKIEGRKNASDQAVIQNRIDAYTSKSEPCLAYCQKTGLVRNISGLGTIEDVFFRIQSEHA